MSLKLGVIMDPIAAINIKKDSTFAMLLAAQKRKWPIYYMEQSDLFLRDGIVYARMRELQVHDKATPWFSFGAQALQILHTLDVVLMRKDPPVDTNYVHTTQLLEFAEQAGTLIVNKPQSLRGCNEKIFSNWFPQCCPPTLVSHHITDLREFINEHADVICKPLDGMGGNMIFRLKKADPNINVVLETLTALNTRLAVAQQYIPEISQGDKRILLIDGEPIPYALARIAVPGETRANLMAGGTGVGVELTERDRWICAQVGPVLREKGLLFVGIDVIGDYLTEINVTSPTCIRELDTIFGLNISEKVLDCIELHKKGDNFKGE